MEELLKLYTEMIIMLKLYACVLLELLACVFKTMAYVAQDVLWLSQPVLYLTTGLWIVLHKRLVGVVVAIFTNQFQGLRIVAMIPVLGYNM
jgi:hypothetical protein